MKKIITLSLSLIAVFAVGLVAFAPTPAFAAANCNNLGSGASAANVAACSACQAEQGATWDQANKKCVRPGNQGDLNNTIHTVINVMLFIVGILAVIMIIYGGIRYIISRGKSEEVTGAKNTIMYSVVGLVIAIIAFALVQWVFTSLAG